MVPSTTKFVQKSFSKDYDDIKKYGDRVNGYIHIYDTSIPKTNLSDLTSDLNFIDSDDSLLEEPSKSIEEILKDLKEKN